MISNLVLATVIVTGWVGKWLRWRLTSDGFAYRHRWNHYRKARGQVIGAIVFVCSWWCIGPRSWRQYHLAPSVHPAWYHRSMFAVIYLVRELILLPFRILAILVRAFK